jgi:antitoxin (DNA-binding transcriptional repressor) of toxin-antitoxin stability system
MKSISQRELRNGSAAVMDAVERGEVFRITRNGVAVAELRPMAGESFVAAGAVKKALVGLPPGDHAKLRAEADALFGEDSIDD